MLGMEALALDHAVITVPDKQRPRTYVERVVTPPQWAPWSLMAGGAVVVLYSFSLPRRWNG